MVILIFVAAIIPAQGVKVGGHTKPMAYIGSVAQQRQQSDQDQETFHIGNGRSSQYVDCSSGTELYQKYVDEDRARETPMQAQRGASSRPVMAGAAQEQRWFF